MMRHIRKLAQINPGLIAIMEKALDSRNYMTHHFFRTQNFAIQSESGRAAMMADLRNRRPDLDQG